MTYIVATDVGGTCTDTVIVENGRNIYIGKVLSTPPNFARGIIDSIQSAAAEISTSISIEELLAGTSLFIHGSTVVDNTLLERKGSKTGLLVTEGFEDTLFVTRGAYGRWSGLNEEQLKHPVKTYRPEPLLSDDCVRGVQERIDYKGAVVRDLDEDSVTKALHQLLEKPGLSSIAVCLLWSFKQPKHEQQIRDIISRVSPHTHVSLSSDIAPMPGEYERTSTTVINAYTGAIVSEYLDELRTLLKEYRYKGPLLVMQGYGGLITAEHAARRSVTMLECGPVAGVIGSKFLGDVMGDQDIIAADMGGTTFKVGVVQGGELEYAREPLIDRFHYMVPKVEVASIGAGGGSLITLEQGTSTPKVGPESAGADPGPICYDRGGTEPTLTDVLLLVGYMDPDTFLGGSMKLDVTKTKKIFQEKIADPLGMSVEEAAIGIFRIASAQAGDLIHKITVEQGLDPRDFVLHAFGGSCPMLAASFAKELKVKRIVVPYAAPVNCAFGLATADIVHEYSVVETRKLPISGHEVNEIFDPMIQAARKDLHAEGFADDSIQYKWSIGLRYAMQVHEVITPVHSETPLDEAATAQLIKEFERIYEGKYGKGSAYRDAGIEMTQFRLSARGMIDRPEVTQNPLVGADSRAALIGRRKILADASGKFVSANIYDFEKLQSGNELAGPAVIHTPITTIVIQEEQTAHMDTYRNIVIQGVTQ